MTGAYGRLISSILIGAAGSLFATAVSLILGQRFGKAKVSNKMVVLTVVLAAGLAIASTFIGFDIHHVIPNLDYLTLAEAEDRLSDQRLDSIVFPVDKPGIQLGRVLANSQSLSPGQLVRSGTPISFGVSDEGTSSVEHPSINGQVDCIRTSEGFCTITVEGRASALVSDGQLRLLLWVKSQQSDWYLQDPTSTQTTLIRPDQTWTRQVQVGNVRYPPSDGELVDLALTVISSTAERHSTGTHVQGPFRKPEGWPVATVERVSIRLIGGS